MAVQKVEDTMPEWLRTTAPTDNQMPAWLNPASVAQPQVQQVKPAATQEVSGQDWLNVSSKPSTVSQQIVPTVSQTSSGVAKSQPSAAQTQSNAESQKGVLSNGMFDKNYVASSEEEVMNSSVDPYTRQIWLANFYKSKGLNLDTGSMAGSWFEEAQKGLERTAKETSSLRQELDKQKEEATQRNKEQQAANQAQFGLNREGSQSDSNLIARNQIGNTLQSRYDSQMSGFQREADKLDMMMAEQSKNYVAGREDQIRSQMAAVQEAKSRLIQAESQKRAESMQTIKMLQDSGALANLDEGTLQYLQEGLPGAPPGLVSVLSKAATEKALTEGQKEKFQVQTQAINNIKSLVDNGIALTPSMILQYSQQTGLPADSLLAFNERAQQIQNDKTLDQQSKMMNMQKLGYELDRVQRGITTAELEKADYLNNLYKTGASTDEIQRTKQLLGIKDMDDPKYRADLLAQQYETEILRKKASGQPVTVDEQLKLAEYQRDAAYYAGNGSQVLVPTKSTTGIKATSQNGKLVMQVPANTQYQCGAYVNRVWGQGVFGNEGTQKVNIVNSKGVPSTKITNPMEQIKPGYAFIQGPTPRNKWGHVGIVTKVYPDGTFDTSEANIDGRCQYNSVGPGQSNVQTRHRSIDDVYGFVPPPKGSYQVDGDALTGGTGNNLVSQFMQQAKAAGITSPKDAMKWANEQAMKSLESSAKATAKTAAKAGAAPIAEIPQNLSWAETAILNTYGDTEKGEKAQNKIKQLQTALSKGDGRSAKSMIMNSFFEGATSGERKDFEDALTMKDSYAKLKSALTDFKKAGLQTGIAENNMANLYKSLYQKQPEQTIKLQQRLNQTFDAYRKAVTGAGASVGELAQLQQSMPNINRNIDDMTVMLDVVQGDAGDALDRKVEMMTRGTFGSYDEMKSNLDEVANYKPGSIGVSTSKNKAFNTISDSLFGAFKTQPQTYSGLVENNTPSIATEEELSSYF